MKLNTKLFSITLHLVLLFLLSSCARKNLITDINEIPQNKSIVFGKLTLMDSEGIQQWDSKIFETPNFYNKPLLIMLPPNTTEANSYEIKGNGVFCWALSPGEYNILGFANGIAGRSKSPVRVKFTVPEGTKSLYIGNFILEVDKSRYSYNIKDDYLSSFHHFKNRFPHIRDTPSIEIMSLEEKLGSFEKIDHICSPDFGIDCDHKVLGKSFGGVIPLTPVVSFEPFQVIDNTTPSFSWKPSSHEDITYDLVIYEAATYYFDGYQGSEIPGRVALYVEDLKNPEYQLTKELNPATKYYWSVRLRRNDLVSTWSKFHYFYTVLLVTTFGTNQWFTFETPSNDTTNIARE